VVTALRIGPTDVGSASAVLDDDQLVLTVRAGDAEKRLRLKLPSIEAARRGGDELELELRDAPRVSLAAPRELVDGLFDRCRSIPELTRTLRSFGSSRARRSAPGARETDAVEQQRFFAPLLEARRSAGARPPAGIIGAFDTAALTTAFENTLHQFALDRHAEPGPAQRALEAELIDATAPLFEALRSLSVSAMAAAGDLEDMRLWRTWSRQLGATFEAADRVWAAIDEVLDSAHRSAVAEPSRRPRRFFRK
jgi:hypothetical protein